MSDLTICYPPYSGWIMLAVLAIVGTWMCVTGLRRRRLVPVPGRCGQCGYDTRVSTNNICNECGCVIEHRVTFGRRRPVRFIIGLGVIFGLPIYAAHARIEEFGWRYYTAVGPLYWLLPDIKWNTFEQGSCVVTLARDRRDECFGGGPTRLMVRNGRELIYDCSLDHYTLGWKPKDSTPPSLTFPAACDLDGDGLPELIITTDNIDDRERLLVVSGGSRPHVWLGIYQEKAPSSNWQKGIWLDYFYRAPDGELLIAKDDPALVNWKSARLWPAVILRCRQGRFEVATDRMSAPLPSEAMLAEAAGDAREALFTDDGQLRGPEPNWHPLLEPMCRLIYTGHADAAEAFLDRVWIGTTADKADLLNDLHDHLQRSLYWPSIVELNKATVPESTLCESD